MRVLTKHKLNDLNNAIRVSTVPTEPGNPPPSTYVIDVFGGAPATGGMTTILRFQDGPIREAGFNGMTNEALLAIVADRLEKFQGTEMKCKANACALTHIEEALHWLHSRTIERMQRGVEGTHEV